MKNLFDYATKELSQDAFCVGCLKITIAKTRV